MSLSIHIISEGPDDQYAFEETPYGIFDGVGSERLWAAPVIRELGATYLPQLTHGYLRVRSEETGDFLRECATLLAHAPQITAATLEAPTIYTAHEHYVERNLSTMIYMTFHARRNEGGILIW
ncbi:hypothetical protein Acy02nite_31310 [Actinoplanes cyaneus]|uniref:Uncharacterized protein n=1 Tax=Actinoplanes cyaneus TaxID=52696 RepID=A0A919IFU9_9ACTN|nr:hypothetical protein [Actinoplanes cyaneus]MCW2142442.1 hypothetical protein [Actinoplanes cyaneus]GID65250.1 hypothetical protein Acy02nite_31310 [Actinoplanes cyaneus]